MFIITVKLSQDREARLKLTSADVPFCRVGLELGIHQGWGGCRQHLGRLPEDIDLSLIFFSCVVKSFLRLKVWW